MTHAFRLEEPRTLSLLSDVAADTRQRRRVLIASGRLPLSVSGEDGHIVENAGGVSSALRAVHDSTSGAWLGALAESELQRATGSELTDRLRAMRAVPVILPDATMDGFTSRYANGILWPALHEVPCPSPGDRADWPAYRAANECFADAIVDAYRPGDVIWIHDYQLLLLPAMVRRRLPDATIAFFLHTPVPPAPYLRSIRDWPELLEGLLGADVIGVHTQRYVRNLIDAVRGRVQTDSDGCLLASDGRRVRVEAHPVGIDSRRFDRRARHPDIRRRVSALREGVHGPIFLGVDRLDYTKGIAERLRAFERLLRFEPGLHERAKFIQVAFPSREGVAGYAATRRIVESLVASINARYATPTWRPVEYIYESVDQDTLIALYCAADVMVVTPRRDGMNLVAKEFAASRCDEGGVLVLSETAGAAAELSSAVLVDPSEPSAIMEGYRRALTLSASERRTRMRNLRTAVRLNNVRAWASCCLDGVFEAVAGTIQSAGNEGAVLGETVESE